MGRKVNQLDLMSEVIDIADVDLDTKLPQQLDFDVDTDGMGVTLQMAGLDEWDI